MHPTNSDYDEEDENLERELPYCFEKELIQKQNKRKYVLDKYIPTVRVPSITLKFHARHDQNPIIDKDSYRKYFQVAHGFLRRTRETYNTPVLEGQSYGWIPRTLDYNKIYEMNGLRKTRNRCDLTIFGEKVFCDKVSERPQFNGLKFFLR